MRMLYSGKKGFQGWSFFISLCKLKVMNFKLAIASVSVLLSLNGISQNKKAAEKTEVLTYVSALLDPASEESQVEFKTANNEKRVFYYSKQDELKLEEQFFNKPVIPPLTSDLNITKEDLVGKKYKVTYHGLTEHATSECCFKMTKCESSK